MQSLPEFVRDEESLDPPVRPTSSANLTGWETVIFQVVVEGPESDDSASATAALAP
jgi:hypothetical protein